MWKNICIACTLAMMFSNKIVCRKSSEKEKSHWKYSTVTKSQTERESEMRKRNKITINDEATC